MTLAEGLATSLESGNPTDVNVTVVTPTPIDGFDDASLKFHVVRQPRLLQLIRLLKASDVVHLAGPCFVPMVAGLLLRKPIVVEHHGFQTICPNGQLLHEPTQTPCPGHFMAGRHGQCVRCNMGQGRIRSLISWLLTFPRRWLCGQARINVMPTQWLSSLLQLPRSTTVYHGLSKIKSADPSPVFSPTPTFAFMGRLVSTKGTRVLLEAAHQVRAAGFEFRYKVIGDGPDRAAMETQIADLGLSDTVTLLGRLAPNDLEKHLADVFAIVMPSLAGEVFGLVAAENMARGKLLIASDIGSLSEVIGDAGLTFAPGDTGGLARRMKEALLDAELAKTLGQKASQRAAEKFDCRNMLNQHLEVYRAAFQ